MFRLLFLICLLALACPLLGGCGIKGPLVMPGQATQKKQHKPPPAPTQTSAGESSGTKH